MRSKQIVPLSVIRLSKKFLDAASLVQSPAKSSREELTQLVSFVAYFLAGHSIELSLKAFLLGRGVSMEKLRSRDFGHDLSKLIVESRRRKLGKCVKLNAKELMIIRLLNECYQTKELEYAFKGSRSLPNYSELLALATKLHTDITPYCNKLASKSCGKSVDI